MLEDGRSKDLALSASSSPERATKTIHGDEWTHRGLKPLYVALAQRRRKAPPDQPIYTAGGRDEALPANAILNPNSTPAAGGYFVPAVPQVGVLSVHASLDSAC